MKRIVNNGTAERLGLISKPLKSFNQADLKARQRQTFDFGWKFCLSDPEGAQESGFNDSAWRVLNVPHDWSIEGEYSEDHITGAKGGYLPAGIGWYRKSFDMLPEWNDKKVFLEFDGIYMNSDVYINGQHLGCRPYGYSSFEYDITPFLKQGKNIIAVRVDCSKAPSGRWYTGSGIYRHTWLTVTDNVHVSHWGTYVTTPEITKGNAKVNIKTSVQNETLLSKEIKLISEIFDQYGKQAGISSFILNIPAKDNIEIEQSIDISSPNLWSLDDPYLYTLKTRVLNNNEDKVLDDYHTDFGVRAFRFDSSTGFYLNDKPMKLKGVNHHHDAGPLGAAVPDKEVERRLLILKQMGVNALRTGHMPMAPEFYDLCNRIGLMVMNEAFDGWETPKKKSPFDYGNYFNDWWDKDLGDMVKRDRNHPSVILWSIGNEVPERSIETQTKLLDLIHRMDPTRPVTAGYNKGSNDKFRAMLDVAGYNDYIDVFSVIEADHEQYPDLPMVGTELPHTYQTRGEYKTQTYYYSSKVTETPSLTPSEIFDTQEKYESSYDNNYGRTSNRTAWKFVIDHPYFTGFFRWTGFDYLGEADHHPYPYRHGDKGVIDLVGFPKDTYYFYKSQWTEKPVIHILPHWNHPGMDGVELPVWVYTNYDSVELLINGKSLGEKEMTDDMYISWNVPYTPGELKAVGRKKGINEVITDTKVTASYSAKINLYTDNSDLEPDSRDISHVVFEVADKEGNFAANAKDTISFNLMGPVINIGMDNGDPIDLTPYKLNYRKVFNGLGMGFFQSTNDNGDIEVIAGGILCNTAHEEKPTIAIDVQSIMLRGDKKAKEFKIYYTTDGSEPTGDSQLYTEPFKIKKQSTVKAIVFDREQKLLLLESTY